MSDMTREEAMEILKEDGCGHCTWQSTNPYECENKECEVKEALDMAIKALEQEPKTGHWIERIERDEYNDYEEEWFECDQCHIDAERPCNYCPNCGAKMVEPQESEDDNG